ncbi:hypothetical protein TREES_T100000120 [Tupaia chinensis]|uniref:Uncharacterized protein n=1 Tax=Tupaia chinensis TaxID=246437 RepID=L9LAL9_TUPCH|nr:hypothetical protein TREES_T100000120 [Tupaia chinensis]
MACGFLRSVFLDIALGENLPLLSPVRGPLSSTSSVYTNAQQVVKDRYKTEHQRIEGACWVSGEEPDHREQSVAVTFFIIVISTVSLAHEGWEIKGEGGRMRSSASFLVKKTGERHSDVRLLGGNCYLLMPGPESSLLQRIAIHKSHPWRPPSGTWVCPQTVAKAGGSGKADRLALEGGAGLANQPRLEFSTGAGKSAPPPTLPPPEAETELDCRCSPQGALFLEKEGWEGGGAQGEQEYLFLPLDFRDALS